MGERAGSWMLHAMLACMLGLAGLGAWKGRYHSAAWILGFAAATWLLARVHGKMRARGSVAGRFFAWLGEHRHQVAQGVGMFQGVRITPGTRLLRFTRVLSLGFLTFRTQTRLYVEGVEPHPDKPETF